MKLISSLFAIALAFTANVGSVRADETKTVVEIAAGNADFSTLVAAVKAAGLAETLSGDGPFTVFAPTNAAFAKLPKGTVEDLLKPENKAKLAAILTYHVVAGKVLAKDVKAGAVKTVNGAEAKITVEGGGCACTTVGNSESTKSSLFGLVGLFGLIAAKLRRRK